VKYSSVDRLDAFEFHDSELKLEFWDNSNLIVSAKHLNIHKHAAPNHLEADMEIKTARIVFSGLTVKEFEPGRAWYPDENGELYTDDPLVIHKNGKALELFLNELRQGITVISIDFQSGEWVLDAVGECPYFFVRFIFSSVEVRWDDYSQKAWYELRR